MNGTPLERFVGDLIVKSIMDREERKRQSIHATDLSQPCMRRIWYDVKEIPYEFDFKTICNFEMGNIIHNRIILNKRYNEVELKGNIKTGKPYKKSKDVPTEEYFECVSGKADDLINFAGETVIVDKKTYSSKYEYSVPTKPSPDYIFQLNEYKLLYFIKTGQEINKGVIAYIDVATKMHDYRVFEVQLLPIEEIKKQMIAKLTLVGMKEAPPRVVSKRCLTCPFFKICKPSEDPNYLELVKIWI